MFFWLLITTTELSYLLQDGTILLKNCFITKINYQMSEKEQTNEKYTNSFFDWMQYILPS